MRAAAQIQYQKGRRFILFIPVVWWLILLQHSVFIVWSYDTGYSRYSSRFMVQMYYLSDSNLYWGEYGIVVTWSRFNLIYMKRGYVSTVDRTFHMLHCTETKSTFKTHMEGQLAFPIYHSSLKLRTVLINNKGVMIRLTSGKVLPSLFVNHVTLFKKGFYGFHIKSGYKKNLFLHIAQIFPARKAVLKNTLNK